MPLHWTEENIWIDTNCFSWCFRVFEQLQLGTCVQGTLNCTEQSLLSDGEAHTLTTLNWLFEFESDLTYQSQWTHSLQLRTAQHNAIQHKHAGTNTQTPSFPSHHGNPTHHAPIQLVKIKWSCVQSAQLKRISKLFYLKNIMNKWFIHSQIWNICQCEIHKFHWISRKFL